jgi:hypothetical protein
MTQSTLPKSTPMTDISLHFLNFYFLEVFVLWLRKKRITFCLVLNFLEYYQPHITKAYTMQELLNYIYCDNQYKVILDPSEIEETIEFTC